VPVLDSVTTSVCREERKALNTGTQATALGVVNGLNLCC
jgi:hypothetical protein